ncbi:3-deoxy-D-manno-octulosonic acid transferase [Confluentibacter flavum]|uniref:3-deoxy-D-manno-octulosonic acid transferase n=1 Tax=Confluentibacter flavum TaxID=1909700 RepID=A0A2N3HG04_9FLAO|nr:glycosyltransferase N-terminal domain-containing protein [Confluentibacter flavum]PKQ43718.1 3-deoxy-D-manno-octulosonic acid transferase [Confluentibacter flavum]
MGFIYNIGIHLVHFGLKCASTFNEKIKKGVVGRQNVFAILRENIKANDKTIWFHCASLGEYEQGLPVFKVMREHYKRHKIVLSFFSPSGYEIRKNSPIADVVIYLPLDTKNNAKHFLDIVKPELTVFVKYDIWPNFLNELKKRKLRTILISANFRENHSFFKFYGKPRRQALFAFEHIFTQNESSKKLLQSIHYNNITVSGDTRFDRVSSQLEQDNHLDFIEIFKQDKLCIVAGSTWPEDEALLTEFINHQAPKDVKCIIAPHNMKAHQIRNIKESLTVDVVLFSEMSDEGLKSAKVLIVDTIGILSKIYSYADIAFVGGAVGTTGLHNILEPAVFGVPIIIGNNYSKFPEAKEMIDTAGVFSISNQNQLNLVLTELIENPIKRSLSGNKNSDFIKINKGALNKILEYLDL